MKALVWSLLLLAGCTSGDPFEPCVQTQYWSVHDTVLVVDSVTVTGCS